MSGEITNDLNQATTIYSELLTNTSEKTDNQYEINKGYILINEMQNAVKLQDVSVFLIKYKNLLEELNSIWYNMKRKHSGKVEK